MILVSAQVSSVASGVTTTDGSVLSNVVDTEAVEVHPFAPVTVTVKVPAVVTAKSAVVPTTLLPSDHE